MKVLVIIASLLLVAVVATEGRKCHTAEDCGENECCAQSGLIFLKGQCKPMAKENEKCSESDSVLDSTYMRRCPCESGLVCKAEKVIKYKFLHDVEIRINERCVNENEVTTGAEVTEEVTTRAEVTEEVTTRAEVTEEEVTTAVAE